jgi:hypothetical protein
MYFFLSECQIMASLFCEGIFGFEEIEDVQESVERVIDFVSKSGNQGVTAGVRLQVSL